MINRGYGRSFFWDARSPTLEAQVLLPIQDPNEMDLTLADVTARTGLGSNEIAQALASYVRSILSGNAPYDRYTYGNADALTREQQAGLQLFRGKGNCTACHVGPNLTDERLHNTGVAWRDGRLTDVGAGRGDFKTPTLREVARTAPYMHDGSLPTLEDVVDFYDKGGNKNPNLDGEILPLAGGDILRCPGQCRERIADLPAHEPPGDNAQPDEDVPAQPGRRLAREPVLRRHPHPPLGPRPEPSQAAGRRLVVRLRRHQLPCGP